MDTEDYICTIYGYRTGCKPCQRVKELLGVYNIPYNFIEVSKGSHPFKTVPQVFVGTTHIGGYQDIKKHLEG